MQSTKNKFVQASYVKDLSVFTADIKQRITDFAKILIACKGVPGITISIVKDDNIWLLPLGYRDLENKSPITEDTKFLIGSITKTFTAHLTAILIQESQEKISWDTPLKEIYRPNLTRFDTVKTAEDFYSQDIAKPYIPVEGEIKNCDLSVYVLGPIAVAGDILSNAKDMAKWLQFVLRQG
ncbi:beta-lactamase [Biomphalaria pfeifferi]|uniref:Beta-lactamase n=1 Tax=Biomphalaria pfeifferi TaxID=112525 RepID=A0AAD8BAC1_BIOPF|nr:beta-lactamase [Biomphalaria pfeifferi]